MKDKYHTFTNDNKKAEVFLDTTAGPKGIWIVECSEKKELVKLFTVANEKAAELLSDEWVMGELKIDR